MSDIQDSGDDQEHTIDTFVSEGHRSNGIVAKFMVVACTVTQRHQKYLYPWLPRQQHVNLGCTRSCSLLCRLFLVA